MWSVLCVVCRTVSFIFYYSFIWENNDTVVACLHSLYTPNPLGTVIDVFTHMDILTHVFLFLHKF